MKEKIINLKNKALDYLKKNYTEILIVGLIVAVGSVLRLYRISEYMTFLGDEGRDAIIVRRFLVDFDLMLIGPGTSVGNMYLGPLYYYFIAPFLWLFNYSPVGPSVMVALVGIATVILVYIIGREWFSKHAGYIAAGLYAISPTIIIYSHSSWNPNIMPFFSLLAVYSIWSVWKKQNYINLLVCGVAFAFVMQSHYLGALLAPVIAIFWAMAFLISSARSGEINDRSPITKFNKYSLISLVIFLFLMSPLVIFDARHGWRNFSAMNAFFTQTDSSISTNIWETISKIPGILNQISTRLLAGKMAGLGKIIVAVVSIPSILLLLGRKRLHKNEASGFSTLAIWIGIGLVGLGFYNHEIYDHYFGFLFAAPFLFLGGFLDGIFESLSRAGKVALSLALLFVVYVNIVNSPLRSAPARQMQRAQEVAQKIADESGGEAFNLAVLAERNYEDGYQYFLEKQHLPVVDIDAQLQDSIKNQLFVVCEMIPEKCDPTHSPKAEVANFGWSRVEDSWEVAGVTIYKLVHSK